MLFEGFLKKLKVLKDRFFVRIFFRFSANFLDLEKYRYDF